jgi:hypothetical protein
VSNPDRAGIYRLTLGIGLSNGEQSEELDVEELVPGWRELSAEQFKEALYAAWKEWAWEYIDGGIDRIDREESK